MSKQGAMSLLSGEPVQAVNASLVTGDMPVTDVPQETPVVKDLDSDRFARIAAREAKLQQEREALKSEQQKLYENKKSLEELHAKAARFEELRKTDPLEAFKSVGLTDTDIMNMLAGKAEPTPDERAQELARLEIKKFQDEMASKETAAAKERDEKAIQGFKSGIGQTISKEADKYEYLAYNGSIAEDVVYETVLGILKDEPNIAPHEALKESLELVESYYEEMDKDMAVKIKKRQPKPVDPDAPLKAEVSPQPLKKPPLPTLNNKATATVASTANSTKRESLSEKKERLMARLRDGR